MRRWLVSAGLFLAAACGGHTESLTVENGSYRAPLVDGAPGVAYFSITSNTADRITALSSPDAGEVQIHQSGESGGMSTMHMLQSVELPAGKTVTFGPGGLHAMVLSPVSQRGNATFRIQITLESGRVETISLPETKPGA